ncbi:ATP-binding cassette domain-containing protein [Psychroflexus maritimus]|uniref:ATP-binding cassette domain-containing protein n=1 Tax=Psychroflexus maritimus TaxID=2714865 RepID=A0A967AB91_9FLAO|nr:ATP-binding cassette domain-containing protein [Psychroflexus maritimus]NGZ88871.1 ATP-binding cassette domain-containing protein [Psychroflexus maritimus]
MSIKVVNLTKSYGKQRVLSNINFEIPAGQITGLLGPNGAGKSTLMKIITGYLIPNNGEAKINQISLANNKINAQKTIGYLPEQNPLYDEMYVREYLEFHRNIHQLPSKRIDEVIDITRLEKEAHKKIEQLSKGYKQRVGFAAAIIHEPKVLILDEPTSGFDPKQLVEIRNLIKEISKSTTVLISTHIMQEVEALCERVLIINKGELIADKMMNNFNSYKQQIIEVEFDYRVEKVALEILPNVDNVINTKGFVYEIYFSTEIDMRPKVFDLAHDIGLKIVSLNKVNQSLENYFLELIK